MIKTKGIYQYKDLKTNKIVYIGKVKAKGLEWIKYEEGEC